MKSRMVRIAKWLLCLAVLVFVARRAAELWRRDAGSLEALTLSWPWMFASMAAYLIGWLPSVWFWRALMGRMCGRVGFLDTARAYFAGHLGKYVPGKAAVVVVRAGMMKARGVPASVAALTTIYETLTMMASGLAVGVALAPSLLSEARIASLPNWLTMIVQRPWLPPLLVAGLTAGALPIIAVLFTAISVRMTPAELRATGVAPRIDVPLLAAGVFAFVISWLCHGVSLGCTLAAVGVRNLSPGDLPVWTGSVSLSSSIGFAVLFAPGGIGVREGLLIETLRAQPQIAPAQAVAASVLLRLLWLFAEILAAGALYYGVRAADASGTVRR